MRPLTGFALSLGGRFGEYGSVIFIAGNLPLKTEIAPLLIVIKLEEFNDTGAAAIGIAMLMISFAMLFVINALQVWSRRRIGNVGRSANPCRRGPSVPPPPKALGRAGY